jgi:hypothetical protein
MEQATCTTCSNGAALVAAGLGACKCRGQKRSALSMLTSRNTVSNNIGVYLGTMNAEQVLAPPDVDGTRHVSPLSLPLSLQVISAWHRRASVPVAGAQPQMLQPDQRIWRAVERAISCQADELTRHVSARAAAVTPAGVPIPIPGRIPHGLALLADEVGHIHGLGVARAVPEHEVAVRQLVRVNPAPR